MKIYDIDADKNIKKVTLYLTLEEAEEMQDSLESLISASEKSRHEHIPDGDGSFKREVTLCIYNPDQLSNFDDRSKKLILRDE